MTSQSGWSIRPSQRFGAAVVIAFALALWLAATAGSPAFAQPTGVDRQAALVVQAGGDIRVTRKSEQDPVRRYDVLERGDVLQLASGARLALLYPGAKAVWTLTASGAGAGRVRVDAKSPVALDPRVTLEKRDLPSVYGEVKLSSSVFAQAALVMRSETPLPRFRTPNDELWLDSRVAISWESLPPNANAPGFTVELVDADRSLIDKRDVTEADVSWAELKPGAYLARVSFVDVQGRSRANVIRFAVASPERARAVREAQPGADATEGERAAFDALRRYLSSAP